MSYRLRKGKGAGYGPLHKDLDIAGPDTSSPKGIGSQTPALSGLLPGVSGCGAKLLKTGWKGPA